MDIIHGLFKQKDDAPLNFSKKKPFGKKFTQAELFIICDLDGTLIDDQQSDGLAELKEWLQDHSSKVVFGVATGRNKDLTRKAFNDQTLPKPDLLICSAGSEIYYTEKFIPDNGWESHIDFLWEKQELQTALQRFPRIRLQGPEAQWRFKLSYFVDDDFNEDDVADLHKFLDDQRLRAKILLTENHYLDFLPYRASKGSAVRYLSYKWKIAMDQIITAGNSGNDIDMVKGKMKGIVVANYSEEMEVLKKSKVIYFSKGALSKGVLEGIKHHVSTSPKLSSLISQRQKSFATS